MPDDIERVPCTEQDAAASYTRLSKWYDGLSHRSEGPHIAEGVRLLNVQPGERVLEVGFGTGHSLVALAEDTGPTGKVFGIDLSPGMIAVARAQIKQNPIAERVAALRGSARQLPYTDASFDAVFSSFMLDLIDTPDIPLVLGEMRRVLKASGRLGLVSLSKTPANVIVKVYERCHRWLPKVIDCRPIYLQHAVEAAGLRCAVQRTRSMWGLPVEIVIAVR